MKRLFQKACHFVYNLGHPPVMVLLYHRVGDPENDPFLLTVSPENFRDQIRYLAGHFPVLRFEEEWNPERLSFVISFDDGYRDNFLNALPILEEFHLPAVFFVTGDNVLNQHNFFWDEAEYLYRDNPGKTASFQLKLKNCDYAEREELLEKAFAENGRSRKDFPIQAMTPEELKKFASHSCAAIGSHTSHHCRLSSLTPARQKEEIEEGNQILASILGKTPDVFSYPFGTGEDYTETTVQICRETAAFRKVASNFSHPWHPGDSLFEIPRTLVRNWPLSRFRYELFKGFMR